MAIIEMVHITKKLVRIGTVSALLTLVLTHCAQSEMTTQLPAVAEFAPVSAPWTEEELEAMALTLAGECYDEKEHDKRLVCEVILNRVSNPGFGSSILDVLTAENQFSGYWTQTRLVSPNDYEIAEQALRDWHNGGCKSLSEYLFFHAGDNHENVFYSEF